MLPTTWQRCWQVRGTALVSLGSAPGHVRPCECWRAIFTSSAIADMPALMRQHKPAARPASQVEARDATGRWSSTRFCIGGVCAPAGISPSSGSLRVIVQTMAELLTHSRHRHLPCSSDAASCWPADFRRLLVQHMSCTRYF